MSRAGETAIARSVIWGAWFSKLQEQLLYDEADLMDDRRGPFIHRILLSTGVTLEIPFLWVIIHRFTLPVVTKIAKQSA